METRKNLENKKLQSLFACEEKENLYCRLIEVDGILHFWGLNVFGLTGPFISKN
jgi:hypothetical protein